MKALKIFLTVRIQEVITFPPLWTQVKAKADFTCSFWDSDASCLSGGSEL